eukprot:12038151-Karenia_brevis.AAC.1
MRFFYELDSRVDFEALPRQENGDLTHYALFVVDSYKHLGSMQSPSVSAMPEISHRFATMKSSLGPLIPKLLKNRHMSERSRISHANAYLFSKGLYNAVCWPKLGAKETRAIHTNIMRVYRHIASPDQHEHMHDEQIIRELNVMAPINLLRFYKFCFCVRLFTRVHEGLLKLLFVTRMYKYSWLAGLADDCNFLANHSTLFHSMRGAQLQQWVKLILDAPNSFVGAVRKALLSPECNQRQSFSLSAVHVPSRSDT